MEEVREKCWWGSGSLKSGMRGEIIATGRCGQPCLRKYSAVHLWILQSKNDMVQFKVVSSTRIIISGCDL